MPERNDLIVRQDFRWSVTEKNGRQKTVAVKVGERVQEQLPHLTTPELDKLVRTGKLGQDKLTLRRRA